MAKRLSKPDNRIFAGEGGHGKSTLARHQAKPFKRVLRFNFTGEDENREGAIVVNTKRDLLDHLMMARPSQPIVLCWDFEAFDTYGKIEAFEYANKAAKEAGDLVLLWDEIDAFCSSGHMPPTAESIINHGRHWGLRTFAVARSTVAIAKEHTRNAQRICAGRMNDETAINPLKGRLGVAVEELPGLKDYHFVDWRSGGGYKIRKSPFR